MYLSTYLSTYLSHCLVYLEGLAAAVDACGNTDELVRFKLLQGKSMERYCAEVSNLSIFLIYLSYLIYLILSYLSYLIYLILS